MEYLQENNLSSRICTDIQNREVLTANAHILFFFFFPLFVLKAQWEVLVQGVFTSAQKLPTKGFFALARVPGSSCGAECALSPPGTGDTRAELRNANKA